MYPAFRASWIKLRRPSLLWSTYGAVAAVIALITAVTFLTASTGPTAGQAQGSGPGRQIGGLTVGALSGAEGLLKGLTGGATLLGVIALAVAAAAIAGEYSTGTLRTLLIRRPQRLRLLTGMWAAVATFAVGAALVAAVASAATALLLAGGQGVDTTAWFTADGWTTSLRSVGEVALATAGYATLGSALGVLMRAPVAAVALSIAWLLPIEGILSGTVDGSARWLPGQLLAAVASNGTAGVALGTALITATGYLVVAAVAAGASFARRDVTA